jgi:hypothetical protein
MSVFERVKTALQPLGVPFATDQYLVESGDELPDLFLVYSLVSSPPLQHAEDKETMRTNRVQVSIYNRNGLTSLPNVDGAMTAAGFQRGPRTKVPYNPATRHFGLALEFVEIEESES